MADIAIPRGNRRRFWQRGDTPGDSFDTRGFPDRISAAPGALPLDPERTGNEAENGISAYLEGVDGVLAESSKDNLHDLLPLLAKPEKPRCPPSRPIYNTGLYGDGLHAAGNLASAVDIVVLTKPQNKRTYLLIQNTHALNSLRFSFDVDSTVYGIIIPAGGNMIFDNSIMQNDLHMSGFGGASSYALLFMCHDVTDGT